MTGLRLLRRTLPDWAWINAALVSPAFQEVHARRPLRLPNQHALVNDYVFSRMTARKWTDFERKCADKIDAKAIAKWLCPDLCIPATRATIDVCRGMDVLALAKLLEPFAGRNMIAKPAHSSGAVLYLDRAFTSESLDNLLRAAKRSYFWKFRERQYANMPKRIIIEDLVGDAANEYKFICVRGEPILCQFFGAEGSTFGSDLLRVPSFVPLASAIHTNKGIAADDVLETMLRHARRLSEPHEFVRVDFYVCEGTIYLGELTLTPGASLSLAPGEGAHQLYSDAIMSALAKPAPSAGVGTLASHPGRRARLPRPARVSPRQQALEVSGGRTDRSDKRRQN